MNTLEFITRLSLALILGSAIGIERQWRQKSAGLRTNTLVSMGAAAFTLISFTLTSQDDGVYKGDATRIIGQIVTGIGFLGGGVILRDGLNVQGLNTAATIWCSAAVGSLAGVGLFVEATIVSVAVIISHLIFRPLGLWLNKSSFKNQDQEEGNFYYSFKIRCKEQVENHLRVLILETLKKDAHLQLRSLKSRDNGNPAYTFVEAEILANGKHDTEMEQLAAKLTIEYGVTEVSWEVNGQQND
jgi:putative Mg2+ transporter-C (MgtC) family protein